MKLPFQVSAQSRWKYFYIIFSPSEIMALQHVHIYIFIYPDL